MLLVSSSCKHGVNGDMDDGLGEQGAALLCACGLGVGRTVAWLFVARQGLGLRVGKQFENVCMCPCL